MKKILILLFCFLGIGLSAQVRIGGGILQTSSADNYATHYDSTQYRGWRAVLSLNERNSIKSAYRGIGMQVYVDSNDSTYKLIGGTSNNNWVALNSGGCGLNVTASNSGQLSNYVTTSTLCATTNISGSYTYSWQYHGEEIGTTANILVSDTGTYFVYVTDNKGCVGIASTVVSRESSYTLPTASTSILGGVKVDGSTININGSGVISSSGGGSGIFPQKSTYTLTQGKLSFTGNYVELVASATDSIIGIDTTGHPSGTILYVLFPNASHYTLRSGLSVGGAPYVMIHAGGTIRTVIQQGTVIAFQLGYYSPPLYKTSWKVVGQPFMTQGSQVGIYVPENINNKSNQTRLGTSYVLYPSQYAVKYYVDSVASGGGSGGGSAISREVKNTNVKITSTGKAQALDFTKDTTNTDSSMVTKLAVNKLVNSLKSQIADTVGYVPSSGVDSVKMPSNYSLTNGVSGGRTITGGTGTTDVLNLKGTSGNATTTVPAINLYGGNNGGTLLASFLNNGNIGFGTNDPASYLSGTHGAVIYGTYPSISLSDASDRWMIFKDITGQLEFYSSVLGGAKVIFTNTGYMNFDGSMYFSTENDNAFGNGDGYIKFKSGYNLLHQNTSHNLVFDVYNGGLQKTAMTIFNNGTIEMGKIKGSSSTPSITAGVGAGTSPTVSITGTDMAGQIIVTPGTGCTFGQIVRITFSNSFTSIPYVVFSPANDNASDNFTVNVSIYVTSSTTYFDLIISTNSSTPLSMVQYKWNYLVVQ